MAYNPDIKYQIDGVVSILEAPDPTFDPTYNYTTDDESSADSFYGFALVKFFTWTPTLSGTVYVLPPADDGEAGKADFYVFQGVAPPLSGPSGLGAIADAVFIYDGTRPSGHGEFGSASFNAVAGEMYTLAAVRYTAAFDNNFTDALVPSFSLSHWILTTQPLGGQGVLLPWRPVASGLFACAEGYATTAAGEFAHAEGALSSSPGDASHTEGIGCISSAPASHAEGEICEASGPASHAEGLGSIASARAAHAEGFSLASADLSHTEGSATTASALAAHAEGSGSIASALAAHAEGIFSEASHLAEHAGASAFFAVAGDGQYSRFEPMQITNDATPTGMLLGFTDPISVAAGESYAVDIQLIASRSDVAGTLASWHIRGLFTAAGGALRRVGSLDVLHHNDADASTWAADVVATGANIDIQVTGENAKTIRWVATVHSTKVGV